MKKLVAILLALTMLIPLCLASCGDDEPNPGPGPVGPSTGGDTAGAGDTENNSGDEDEEPEEKVYEPDPDAEFSGSYAIGLNGAAWVDDIKAISVRGKITLVEDDFEETADFGAYTLKTAPGGTWGGDAADWSFETIETIENEGKSTEEVIVNRAAKFAGTGDGAMLCFGENDWNMLQVSMKVKLAEGSSAKLYFGITDESNYYALNVGSSLYVEHCVNGTSTIDTLEIPYNLPVDEFFPISIVQDASTVKCFIAGTQFFEAYKEFDASKALSGGIGFGTWSTQYSIDNIKVTSNSTGEILYENDFENETLSDSVWQSFVAADGAWATVTDGGDWHDDWVITADEDVAHGNILQVIGTITGGGIMLTESIGNSEWTDYTFEFDARKDGGAEGFMPYFAVSDVADPSKADYVRWNQGGWSNTLSCYQVCVEGSLTNKTQTSDKYTNGEWYHVSIQLVENYIIGTVNGELVSIQIN